MPFLDELVPKETNPPSEFDIKCASKLKETLKTKNLITRPVSLKKWSKEFQRLRKIQKRNTIKEVLTWYCNHAGDQYVSVALCAGTFRKKFDNIKLQSERHRSRPTTKKHVQYDTRTLSTYEELKHLHWPKGTKTQLLDAIQDSVLVYDSWRKSLSDPKLRTKVQKHDEAKAQSRKSKINGHEIERFLNELKLVAPKTTFVRDWFLNVNSSVQNWEAWSGNLRSMGLSLSHKKFQAIGHAWANDYCGDPGRWDKLMEMMK